MKLKELREQKGLKQYEVAKHLKMTNATYSRYEKGQRQADYETLIKIANYFNVTIDYLLSENDTPTKKTAHKENHVTLIGRGGEFKEYELPPENIAALETILENLKKKEN